ncbi:MAG TPA: site-2 protease family protein [Ktedonobacteraceae bacterium]|nr:site-2 protease family protein [Ktedonobacteraceae bacterium]
MDAKSIQLLTGINVLLALMIIASFFLAVAIRECGHALMAYWLGDNTPIQEGRLTLGLRSHLDSVGTLLCVILAFQPLLAAPVGLGWGKPVKPDPWKLRFGADKGVFLVALAGLLSSLIVGLVIAAIARLLAPFLLAVGSPIMPYVVQLLVVFANVNIAMAIFNILPIYPLDGYQMLYSVLPSKQAVQFAKSAPYGPFIILIIFFLVPFIASLLHLDEIPYLGLLFHLSRLIWLLSSLLIGLVGGGDLPAYYVNPYQGPLL